MNTIQTIDNPKELLTPGFNSGISNRIEDGQLKPAFTVRFFEWDMDGRYESHTYMIVNVRPECFTQKKNLGPDGKHYFTYSLNEDGWKWVEDELKIKHPGRGWLGFRLLTKEQTEARLETAKQKLHQAEMMYTHLTNALNK